MYCKEKWGTAGGKGPLFGRVDGFQIDPKEHDAEKFRSNIAREISSNKRSAFVKHHNVQYGGHFPVWVIVELFTFGMLSRFYSDLKIADRKKLEKELYGTVPKM